MSTARLSHIILRVSSMDRAVEFWAGTLGFTVLSRSEEFTFLEAGSCRVALNRREGGDEAARHSLTEMVIEAAEPRVLYDEWHGAGVPFEVGLRPVAEGEAGTLLAAHFRDPDGHLVSLSGWE